MKCAGVRSYVVEGVRDPRLEVVCGCCTSSGVGNGVGGLNVITFVRVVFRLEVVVVSELGCACLPPAMATSNSILFTDCSRYHS